MMPGVLSPPPPPRPPHRHFVFTSPPDAAGWVNVFIVVATRCFSSQRRRLQVHLLLLLLLFVAYVIRVSCLGRVGPLLLHLHLLLRDSIVCALGIIALKRRVVGWWIRCPVNNQRSHSRIPVISLSPSISTSLSPIGAECGGVEGEVGGGSQRRNRVIYSIG